MLANAASPILFKRVFRQDWFRTLSDTQNDETGIESISIFEEMGFIMARQADTPTEKLVNLSYEDYLNWLCQFDTEELMLALGDIAALYRGQEQTSSDPKKEDG